MTTGETFNATFSEDGTIKAKGNGWTLVRKGLNVGEFNIAVGSSINWFYDLSDSVESITIDGDNIIITREGSQISTHILFDCSDGYYYTYITSSTYQFYLLNVENKEAYASNYGVLCLPDITKSDQYTTEYEIPASSLQELKELIVSFTGEDASKIGDIQVTYPTYDEAVAIMDNNYDNAMSHNVPSSEWAAIVDARKTDLDDVKDYWDEEGSLYLGTIKYVYDGEDEFLPAIFLVG